MRKIVTIICLLSVAAFANAQTPTCEQREQKLLSAVGSFSAATMYNTYGTLGGIGDGFGNDVYKAETAADLVNAQIGLLNNLIKVLEDLVKEKMLTSQSDIDYANSAINVFKGLKRQGELIISYTKNKSQSTLDSYDTQRKNNWKDISKLMGLEE